MEPRVVPCPGIERMALFEDGPLAVGAFPGQDPLTVGTAANLAPA